MPIEERDGDEVAEPTDDIGWRRVGTFAAIALVVALGLLRVVPRPSGPPTALSPSVAPARVLEHTLSSGTRLYVYLEKGSGGVTPKEIP